MERRLNVTEARNQLPTLVKEVSEKNNQIIISNRNQPKAIIIGYDAYLQQQERSTKGAKYRLAEILEETEALLEQTIEGCRGSGDPMLYTLWEHMGRLMHEAWELFIVTSEPHALIAFQLYELSERSLNGTSKLKIEQLQPVQYVFSMLIRPELTLEDAAEADRHLLQNDIDASIPLHTDVDLNSLYEMEDDTDVDGFGTDIELQ